jgi:hypothetical protein
MAQVDSKNSISMPVDPTRRRFLTVAASGAVALTATPGADPIYAAIERHKAAGVPWDAAVDVRSVFPEFEPLTDEQWEKRDALDDAEADAREVLNDAGIALINTAPTTPAGFVAAIRYMQRQTRDDGTFMPFDIRFEFDAGSEGDGGVVLGWIDAWLDTIADAVAALDKAVQS